VHGAAICGANGLLAACDMVYCMDDTKFFSLSILYSFHLALRFSRNEAIPSCPSSEARNSAISFAV